MERASFPGLLLVIPADDVALYATSSAGILVLILNFGCLINFVFSTLRAELFLKNVAVNGARFKAQFRVESSSA